MIDFNELITKKPIVRWSATLKRTSGVTGTETCSCRSCRDTHCSFQACLGVDLARVELGSLKFRPVL